MIPCPVIPDCPGLKWRRNKHGWMALWRARTDLRRAGWPIKSYRVWSSSKEQPEPNADTLTYIADRCRSLQADMLSWSRGGTPQVPQTYNKTWASLIQQYQTDTDSPYHKKRFATREHYDHLCRRIEKDCGSVLIADTDTRRLMRLHEGWIKPDEKKGGPPKIAMGHAMINMLRIITTYGATLLKCQDCRTIRSDLKDMRIEGGKPRTVALTAEQATAIRLHVRHNPERRSIGLAQAFQYEGAFRQKDIIGEWVPLEERGPPSDVLKGDMKWIRGLRWEEIDASLVLSHVTSKRQKLSVVNLRFAPMVLDELRFMAGLGADDALTRGHLPVSGPIIVSDKTGLPWETQIFRKTWRKIARELGIPDEIRNMDTRAGAATEATNSGAPLEKVKHLMTHSDIAMTQRYARGDIEKVEDVMKARVAFRNKTGTGGQ